MMRVIQSIMIILIVFALALCIAPPWTLISIGATLIGVFSPNPPIPEIKRGEFPFKLVYEIEGVQFTIEDTLICEYDGIVLKESGGGKRIQWKEWQSSGNNGIVLLSTLPPKDTYNHGQRVVSRLIVYYLGSVEYYMGYDDSFEYTFPDAACHDITSIGSVIKNKISSKDLMNMYRIKLISWEISPPIKNSFR